MKTTLSRRKFLTTTGVVLGAAAVTGLGIAAYRSENTYQLLHPDVRFVSRRAVSGSPRIALTNARFADVTNGNYYEGVSRLVIQDGKIVAMPGLPGQPGDLPVDLTVDLGGRTVIPGLFNTHCHIQNVNPGFCADANIMLKNIAAVNLYSEWQRAKGLADCLTRGVTTIRDAWAEDLSINRRLKEKIDRGEIPGPRIYQSVLVSPQGGPFAPERSFMERVMWRAIGLPTIDYASPHSGVVVFPANGTAEQVRAAVNQAIDERGADYIKIYDQRYKRLSADLGATFMTFDQLAALADQSRSRGVDTLMHHMTVESFRRGVQSGVNTLSHLPIDSALTGEDVQAFLQAGTHIEPTISIPFALCWELPGGPATGSAQMQHLNRYRQQVYRQLADDYWVSALRSPVRATVELNQKAIPNPVMDPIFNFYSTMLTYGLDNLRALLDAGIQFACGTDAGAVQGTASAVPLEIGMYDLFFNPPGESARLTGADFLRLATINSARAMGLDGQLGTLEPGKTADLVILDGDPFQDPGCIGSPGAAVFKDGKLAINACVLEFTSAQPG